MLLMQNHRPAGKVQTRMCRSKKKETQVVGWCSDTDAMMGMWIFAYLITENKFTHGTEEQKRKQKAFVWEINTTSWIDIWNWLQSCFHYLPGVPQGVEAATPRGDVTCRRKQTKLKSTIYRQPAHTVWFCESLGVNYHTQMHTEMQTDSDWHTNTDTDSHQLTQSTNLKMASNNVSGVFSAFYDQTELNLGRRQQPDWSQNFLSPFRSHYGTLTCVCQIDDWEKNHPSSQRHPQKEESLEFLPGESVLQILQESIDLEQHKHA